MDPSRLRGFCPIPRRAVDAGISLVLETDSKLKGGGAGWPVRVMDGRPVFRLCGPASKLAAAAEEHKAIPPPAPRPSGGEAGVECQNDYDAGSDEARSLEQQAGTMRRGRVGLKDLW